mmetsp:Transcript_25909/g.55168  ORF Transcript_25909/g.55168 Transcript_25909/m.55168 type:complete len:219 (-) Transcript_25909:332-988(-)
MTRRPPQGPATGQSASAQQPRNPLGTSCGEQQISHCALSWKPVDHTSIPRQLPEHLWQSCREAYFQCAPIMALSVPQVAARRLQTPTTHCKRAGPPSLLCNPAICLQFSRRGHRPPTPPLRKPKQCWLDAADQTAKPPPQLQATPSSQAARIGLERTTRAAWCSPRDLKSSAPVSHGAPLLPAHQHEPYPRLRWPRQRWPFPECQNQRHAAVCRLPIS